MENKMVKQEKAPKAQEIPEEEFDEENDEEVQASDIPTPTTQAPEKQAQITSAEPEMTATIPTADFKAFLEVGRALDLTELNFTVNKDGMAYQGMDATQVGMACAEIQCKTELHGQSSASFSADLMQIYRLMGKKLWTDATLTITKKGNRLTISSQNGSEKLEGEEIKGVSRYQKEPTVPPGLKFLFPSSGLVEDISKGALISAHITFDYIPTMETLFVRAVGDVFTLTRKSLGVKQSPELQAEKCTFPASYLLDISKAIRRVGGEGGATFLYLKRNMPVKIEGGMCENRGKYRYYLAPRVEDD